MVGVDIQPGTYRTRTATSGCYWERLSGFGGTIDEIIANDFTDDTSVVTIKLTDAGFTSRRCAAWTNDLSAVTTSQTAPFDEGTFIVGTDIAPGTWRAPGGSSCYWQRMRSFSGDFDDIIANDFGGTSPVVAISGTDKGFQTHRCGTWTRQ